MRQWTPEERKRQAELIKQWKPWDKSTGPKTEYGKQCSSQNSRKYPQELSHYMILCKKRQKYQEIKREKIRAENRESWRTLSARLNRLERLLEQRARAKPSK